MESPTPVSVVEPPAFESEPASSVMPEVTLPQTPERAAVEPATPVPVLEPGPAPVQPSTSPDPIVIPEVPPSSPEPIPMEGADAAQLARRSTEGGSSVDAPLSTTEQPNNLTTNPPPAPPQESPAVEPPLTANDEVVADARSEPTA